MTGHGQLTDEEGPPSFTDTDAAVVGGTGRYQNASGSAHLTSVNITTQTYQWDHELYGVAPS